MQGRPRQPLLLDAAGDRHQGARERAQQRRPSFHEVGPEGADLGPVLAQEGQHAAARPQPVADLRAPAARLGMVHQRRPDQAHPFAEFPAGPLLEAEHAGLLEGQARVVPHEIQDMAGGPARAGLVQLGGGVVPRHHVRAAGADVVLGQDRDRRQVRQRAHLFGHEAAGGEALGVEGTMVAGVDEQAAQRDQLQVGDLVRRKPLVGPQPGQLRRHAGDPVMGQEPVDQEPMQRSMHWAGSFPVGRPRATDSRPMVNSEWRQRVVRQWTATGPDTDSS